MLVIDSAWQVAKSATFFLVCMENLQDQIDCIESIVSGNGDRANPLLLQQ
jgi:hypothetical protein